MGILNGKLDMMDSRMVVPKLEGYLNISKIKKYIIKKEPLRKNIWNFWISMKLSMKIVFYLIFLSDFQLTAAL